MSTPSRRPMTVLQRDVHATLLRRGRPLIDLARALGVPRVAVVGAVRSLERKGLVYRQVAQDDRTMRWYALKLPPIPDGVDA